MDESIDIETIERIVEGGVSDLERKELLARMVAEDSSDSWRSLALGLLEKEILRETFAEPDFEAKQPKPKNRAWLLVGLSAAMLMIGAFLSNVFLQGSDQSALAVLPDETRSIEMETTYVAAQLEDGRQLVIPVSHFRVSDSTR